MSIFTDYDQIINEYLSTLETKVVRTIIANWDEFSAIIEKEFNLPLSPSPSLPLPPHHVPLPSLRAYWNMSIQERFDALNIAYPGIAFQDYRRSFHDWATNRQRCFRDINGIADHLKQLRPGICGHSYQLSMGTQTSLTPGKQGGHIKMNGLCRAPNMLNLIFQNQLPYLPAGVLSQHKVNVLVFRRSSNESPHANWPQENFEMRSLYDRAAATLVSPSSVPCLRGLVYMALQCDQNPVTASYQPSLTPNEFHTGKQAFHLIRLLLAAGETVVIAAQNFHDLCVNPWEIDSFYNTLTAEEKPRLSYWIENLKEFTGDEVALINSLKYRNPADNSLLVLVPGSYIRRPVRVLISNLVLSMSNLHFRKLHPNSWSRAHMMKVSNPNQCAYSDEALLLGQMLCKSQFQREQGRHMLTAEIPMGPWMDILNQLADDVREHADPEDM